MPLEPAADAHRWQRLEELFSAAIEQAPEDRAAFLDTVAGDDRALREEVLAMLAAHQAPPGEGVESWLAAQAAPHGSGALSAGALAAGTLVGPYRLLHRLGEGGMGQVYLAERADGQFEQRVAIKLLRAGHDDPSWVARFRTERDILARLEHPNIARLLDGGVTAQGLPYLVMEPVRGEPVTDWCDARRLTVEQRIRTFQEICRAAQYAHQNLVVHRDLKPSNILVNERGEVRLLDFGIAKLLEDGDAGTAPDSTRTGAMLLTPSYASPEQFLRLPVTTSTDVYALGLLLYELLSGRRGQEVESLSPAELVRQICEVDPPRPSAAAHGGGAEAEARAALRGGLSASRLGRLLRGDLDTIVATAIHKDPRRRYPSAEQLADDLERYRTGLPLRARPDTLVYRSGKFLRRHRIGVAAAALALVALLAGLSLALVGLGRARRAEAAAQQSAAAARRAETTARAEAETARRTSDLLVSLFKINEPGEARGNAVTAREVLDRGVERIDEELADQPEVRGRLLGAVARAYGELGLFDAQLSARQREVAALTAAHGEKHPAVAVALTNLAKAHMDRGAYALSRDFGERALAIQEKAIGPRHLDLAGTLSQLGLAYWYLEDLGKARALLERSLAMKEALLGPLDPQLGGILNNVAILRWQEGDAATAKPLYERALKIFVRQHGEDHPSVAHTLNNLALVHEQMGDLAQARVLHERALAIRRKILAPDHPDIGESLNNLGNVLRAAGDPAAARDTFRAALAIREAALGPEHSYVATTLSNLGMALVELGDVAEARPLLERSRAIFAKSLGADSYQLCYSIAALAELDHRAGELRRAEEGFRRALALGEKGLGAGHPDLAKMTRSYADLLRQLGRPQEAEVLERRLR